MDKFDHLERKRDSKLIQRTKSEVFRLWMDILVPLLSSFLLIFRAIKEWIVPTELKDVTGQVVLITGGAKGLGRNIALELAMRGCHIALVDIDIENAEKAAKDIIWPGVKLKAFKADVSKFEEVQQLKENIERELGPVDIIINNAALLFTKGITEESAENLQKMVDVNLMGCIWTTRVFLEGMIKRQRGHIVSISSVAGITGLPAAVCYSATKFAVRGFMEALTLDLNHRDLTKYIKVSTVFPYFMDTNPGVRKSVLQGSSHKVIYDPGASALEIVKKILQDYYIIAMPIDLYFPYYFTVPLPVKKKVAKIMTVEGFSGVL